MRITKNVSTEVDVSVEVSLEDIRQALDDAIDESKKNETKYPVRMFCCGLYDCLRSVSDEMIERLPREERQLVVGAFEEELDRFRIRKGKS